MAQNKQAATSAYCMVGATSPHIVRPLDQTQAYTSQAGCSGPIPRHFTPGRNGTVQGVNKWPRVLSPGQCQWLLSGAVQSTGHLNADF